jgi:hypothetical protein
LKKNPAKAKEVQVGFLALNKDGEYGAYCLQKGFTFAVHDSAGNQHAEFKESFRMIVEVVVYNIASAMKAQEGGADRIELCDSPGDGGTTPSPVNRWR